MTRKYFALLCVLGVLTACTSRPSSREVTQEISTKLLQGPVADTLTVKNVQRINGYPLDANKYVVEVSYDLVFTKSFDELQAQLRQSAETSPLDALGAGAEFVTLRLKYGEFVAGRVVTETGKFTFIHTEKGWRLFDDD